jgi:hypothetical protein
VGSASTWSLDRIASLAEEATRAFYLQLRELGVAGAVESAAEAEATDSALLTLHLDLVRSYPMQLIQVGGWLAVICCLAEVLAGWRTGWLAERMAGSRNGANIGHELSSAVLYCLWRRVLLLYCRR